LEFWLNVGLLYFLVKKIEKTPQKEGIIMAILFSLFALAIFFIRFQSGDFDMHLQPIFSFTNIGVIRCIVGFLIGILVYYASQSALILKNFSKSKPYIFLCELILLALLCYCLFHGGLSFSFLCVFIVFPLIILISAVSQNLSIMQKACAMPIMREFGNFSYAIYLLHVPILCLLANIDWFANKNPCLQTIILCAIVFAVSIPIYYLYEKKAKKILIEKLS
jgi:peptidoglycan/LPS O-acetylase OafA/YrhL